MTIPGLLRRGSPITQGARSGVVVHVAGGMATVAWAPPHSNDYDHDGWLVDRLALDLSDVTGRFHAAMWLDAREVYDTVMTSAARRAYTRAQLGEDLDAEGQAHLAALVARFAGVGRG
jgi:hypothetical protein